jgi:hypothetical protein
MGHGGPAETARFGRTSTAVRAPSGGAPAPRITPMTMVWVGAPPPSDQSAQGAQVKRFDDDG